MKKRQKVTLILLLAIIVLGGAFLYIRTLDQDEVEERPDSALLAPEEVSDPDEATEVKDVKAESEPEEEEVDLQVKVGPDEFPVIVEDGDYENLDKARLIWTVNNLFASGHDFEIIEEEPSFKFHVNGREVESNLYLYGSGRGYRPKIEIRYNDIVEVDGVNHLVLSREFIEAFIEASSKYGELTDGLNNFIDRLNRINTAEFDNLTEAQIDFMMYFDPAFRNELDLEIKRGSLKEFTVNNHFQSTNVFWLKENTELGRYLHGDNAEPVIIGQTIEYTTKGKLSIVLQAVLREIEDYDFTPPSNFDPRLHTDPDVEPFIWVPANTWEFINDNGQWKVAIINPGT